MPTPGRLRWTLTGLAVVALAGAVLLIGFSSSGRDEPTPAPEREAPADPRGPLLQGRADTDAAPVARPAGKTASLRLLAPDGNAAARAAITYRALDRLVDARQGVTDPDGSLALDPAVAGRRCQVVVAAGSSWAAHTFDVWVEGEVTLRLPAGCGVWFEVPATDAASLGQVLRFGNADTNLRRTITERRTLLGRFEGDLRLYALGESQAAASLSALVLPPSGEVTVRWERRAVPQVAAWLRIRGPERSNATPQVTLSGVEMDAEGWNELAARRSEAGAVVIAAAPGHLTVLAVAEGAWAFRQVEAKANEEPQDVDLTWEQGGSLEVRLPVEPHGDVELSLVRLPGRNRDLTHFGVSRDLTPGAIAFDHDLDTFPSGRWPQPPRLESPTIQIWDGLPRGANVRVFVPTERWGTLQADATIPYEGDRATLDVPPGARVTVRAVAEGAPDPDVWVDVRQFDVRPECTLPRGTPGRTRTVHATAVMTGLAPGTSIRIQMRETAWSGAAMATVADGLEVRVPVVRRPMARYRARVVDESGHPLARVGVSFGADFDAGTIALSDADGWAEGETASDRTVRASTAHPGLTSERVEVPVGGTATVVARRYRSVQVVFDIGEQLVDVDETYRGETGGGGSSGPRHVFPGSTYEVRVLPDMTHVRVRVQSTRSGEAPVRFDQEVEVGNAATTTLRVTR